MEKDNLILLKWMQNQDKNGAYLETPLPPIDYAIETIKEWVTELDAEVPAYIMDIVNKY